MPGVTPDHVRTADRLEPLNAAAEVTGRLGCVGGHGPSLPRIVSSVSGLFVPGWGAHAGIYQGAVPAGWVILDPPSFVASGATVAAYRRWIVERCRARPGPFTLARHSFGAVLAVHAALADRVEVERLVLVSPSALPLEKPAPLMFWDFSRRLAAGWFPPREGTRAMRQVLFHPLLARRLGMEVRVIDLSEELAELRDRGVPCTVVAASTDTLTPPSLCRRAPLAAPPGPARLDTCTDGPPSSVPPWPAATSNGGLTSRRARSLGWPQRSTAKRSWIGAWRSGRQSTATPWQPAPRARKRRVSGIERAEPEGRGLRRSSAPASEAVGLCEPVAAPQRRRQRRPARRRGRDHVKATKRMWRRGLFEGPRHAGASGGCPGVARPDTARSIRRRPLPPWPGGMGPRVGAESAGVIVMAASRASSRRRSWS